MNRSILFSGYLAAMVVVGLLIAVLIVKFCNKNGNNLKSLVAVMYAQEVIAFDRMSEFLEILTDNTLKVSHGSLVNWVHEVSNKCKKSKKN